MADIPLDALVSGGEFKATTCSGVLQIAAGASGTLATVTSTGGRKIRLTNLFLVSGSEAGISVTCDGVAVVSSLTLSASRNGVGNFEIGGGVNGTLGLISHVEAFNTITITKASGSTAAIIYYSTEQGF